MLLLRSPTRGRLLIWSLLPLFLQDVIVGSLLQLALPHQTVVAAVNPALAIVKQKRASFWGLSATSVSSGLAQPRGLCSAQNTGRVDVHSHL